MALSRYSVAFALPVVWLAFLGFAALLGQTAWGQEGHPSNSVGLFIYALLGAPLLGLAGGAYVWFSRARYSSRLYVSAIVAHVCLIVAGMGFWIMLWST
jgi:hypothetical protein